MNSREAIPIDYILYSNYMKYDHLKKLTLETFSGSDADNVNIYIDMYQILLEVYQYNRLPDYSVITSSIINLCAHIRYYYRSRHRVETKFFIIYSTNNSRANTQFYMDYNRSHRNVMEANRSMKDIIDKNIELLKLLCPYLPDIHFVTGTVEPGVMMYSIMCKQEVLGNFNPNIIFSKGIYNYQIPAIRGNSVIFKSKRGKGETTCKAITKENVLKEYIYESRNKTLNDYNNIEFLSSELLSLIITLSNFPSRNIKALLSIKNAIDLVACAVKSGTIINGYNTDINYVYKCLNDIKFLPTDMYNFSSRFKSIDLVYQLMIYKESIEIKDESYLLDLYDCQTVQAINNEYFRSNPLDLNRL